MDRKGGQGVGRFRWLGQGWLVVLALGACAPGEEPGSTGAAVAQSASKGAPEADGTLVNLTGRFEGQGELVAEATYKVKRKKGRVLRQIELEVEHAAPGVACALLLDGVELGKATSSKKGKIEFELSEEDGQKFPASFGEPKPGSVLRVGELLELHLEAPEKLTDLQAPIAGPGALTGKVAFLVQRVAGKVEREFQVKVEKAPVKTTHVVTLDGVRVGDLVVDALGEGKLKFSSKEPPDFPAGFPEPRADSSVQVGELFSGKLEDARAGGAAK